MGIESVVYQFRTEHTSANVLREWAVAHGATPGKSPDTFVVATPDCWIDLEMFESEDDAPAMLSLRVALTNPTACESTLVALVADLLDEFGGSIVDLSGKRRFRGGELTEVDSFLKTLREHREAFIATYGDINIPMSADTVFEYLRNRDTGAQP